MRFQRALVVLLAALRHSSAGTTECNAAADDPNGRGCAAKKSRSLSLIQSKTALLKTIHVKEEPNGPDKLEPAAGAAVLSKPGESDALWAETEEDSAPRVDQEDGSKPVAPRVAVAAVDVHVATAASVSVAPSYGADKPYATVPVKWVVITKKDGTGNMSKASLESRMAVLNKYYSGGDPEEITEARVKEINAIPPTPGSCGEKCDIFKCVNSKLSPLIETKGCHCDTVVCKDWSMYGRLQGERADMNITFKMESVEHIVNDTWHEQCCCAHAADLGYENKQVEIIDRVVDKKSVRSSVTVIVCNMKSTLGMAPILGSNMGCSGGPYVMLTTDFPAFTLAHEFGHFFGLFHTFNDYCPSGDKWGTCPKGVDMCDEQKNIGDGVSDTPIHRKQGSCTVGTDSCPKAKGLDPLDNMMSYSMCKLRRFTPEQVRRAHETIKDYFPALLSDGGGKAKDLPCDPEFPDGYRDGYDSKKKKTSSGEPPPTDSGCGLKKGECDTHDKKGCTCSDSSICCKGHGCAGDDGLMKMCLPCSWKSWYKTGWTADACK